MKWTEDQLLQKKKDIEKTKMKLSELKGEEKSLIKQLKDDWQCSTLSETKKKIKSLEEQANELEIKIEKATEKLENKLNQDESKTNQKSI